MLQNVEQIERALNLSILRAGYVFKSRFSAWFLI